MYQDEDIVIAARNLQSHLDELLPAEEANRIGGLLDEVLNAGGKDVGNSILEVIAIHESTRLWLNKVLEERGELDNVKAYSPLPGKPTPIAADRFVCPKGDYVWYRPSVGVPVPLCPNHRLPLTERE
jgi:hypothetical protein